MNIGMIISTPFPPEEGIGFYAYNLSKKLIENGHEVTLFTRGFTKTEEFNYEGIKIVKIPFYPIYPFHVQIHQFFLERYLKDKEFDLFHIHSPLSPPIKTEKPIISTIHTSLVEDMKHFQLNNLRSVSIKLTTLVSGKPLTQKLIDRSKIITTVSSSVSNELKKYYNLNYEPEVTGNGVNETKFIPSNTKKNTKTPCILFVGRLDYRKGVIDLINASKLTKNYNVNIIVAGEGPLKKLFQKEIKDNEIRNVKLLGHISKDNLVPIYQKASIFVFPSHYEGLPTVVLEAMSCGLPVIVSKIPSHLDLIENNYNGLLIEPGDYVGLVDEIKLLIQDDDLKNYLGENARKTILQTYSWSKVSKNYENLYAVIGD